MVTTSQVAEELPGRKSRLVLDAARDIQRKGFLQFLNDEWRRHGDLLRIEIGSRSMVLAVHPEHVRRISLANRDNYDKLESYDMVRELLVGDGVITATGEAWRRQRKLMAPFFTPRGVEQFMPIMLNDAQQFIERWDAKADRGASSLERGELSRCWTK